MLLPIVLFIFSFYVENSLQQNLNSSTLQQVHVVFRHGAKFPDSICGALIANKSETFWPDGWGALTMLGKQQEFNIGQALRQKYGNWLGDIYYPDILDARTTDTPRTKASLELVLAGLFPPTDSQTWNWEMNWQPIPYSYDKPGSDPLLGFPVYCPNFMKEYNRVLNTSEVINYLKPTEKLTNFVNKQSGLIIFPQPIANSWLMYGCLQVLEELEIPMPKWSKLVFPTAIKSVAVKEYILKTYNDLLMKFTGGQLLKKVLDNSSSKIMGKLVPAGQKLYLYSGHEFNIAHVLRALNAFNPHYPPYASYITFELHNYEQKYGYKIYYQNYQSQDPVPIIIPGCKEFCPIDDVKKLLANHLPGSDIVC